MKNKRKTQQEGCKCKMEHTQLMHKNSAKCNGGITLIALVVTIVVLLILAGVSINLVIGQNGIINKAVDAKEKTEQAKANEQTGMDSMYDEMLDAIGESNTSNIVATVDGVPIPKGFCYVGGTKNSGLVISDDSDDENDYQGQETVGTDLKGNQFVWIPVETYSNFHLIEGYYNGSLQTYLSATTNPSRESGSTTTAGTPLEKNSTVGTEESIAMYKSVKNNKGFYIARYEAGISGTTENDSVGTATDGTVQPLSKAGVGVWNSIAWGGLSSATGTDGLPGSDLVDGAVKVARSMYPNTSKITDYGLPTDSTNDTGVISTLCYGVQWDAIMQFIDSNYVTGTCADDSFVKNTTGEWTSDVSGEALHTTGFHAVKNIYDLGGNVGEWTMEAYGSNGRVIRGDNFYHTGSITPVSYRNNPDSAFINIRLGFRVALYL